MSSPEDPVDLERHFNPRVAVPNFDAIIGERQRVSALARERLPFVGDVRYGDAARSTLDVFPAAAANATFVYIHGGYWRSGAAQDNSVIAEPFCDADADVAVFLVNYTLCPDTTVPAIVQQVGEAVAWIRRHGHDYGADPDRMFLCGTSAGAHLAAMLLASDDRIAGACLISGIYDLAPVLDISVNADIGLTPEWVQPMSPLFHLPKGNPQLVMAFGEQEPSLWAQQTRDYAMRCDARGLECVLLEVAGANHFSVPEALYEAQAPIARAMKRVMGLSDEAMTCFTAP